LGAAYSFRITFISDVLILTPGRSPPELGA
jgi:hypothetical protein